MSTQYPILDNRPINQWKVVELKEELRRRKITVKGVKEDLVKRLAEAIWRERELEQEHEADAGAEPESNPANKRDEEIAEPLAEDNIKVITDENMKPASDCTPVNKKDVDLDVNQDYGDKSVDSTVDTEMEGTPDGTAANALTMEHSASETHNLITQMDSSGNDLGYNDQEKDLKLSAEDSLKCDKLDENMKPSAEDSLKCDKLDENVKPSAEDSLKCDKLDENLQPPGEDATQFNEMDEDSKPLAEETLKYAEQDEDSKPHSHDVKLEPQEQNNKVSEINQDLDCPAKSEFGSNDSVSINIKDELKDSLNADNASLEPEAKPEILPSPSINDHSVGSGSCMVDDVQELNDKPVSFVDVDDVKTVTDADLSKKNDIVDGESPEKLNLDRSSGDDSMDEDVLETKQIESNDNSDKLGGKIEDIKAQVGKAENLVDVGMLPAEEDTIADENGEPAASTEKRKPEENQGSAATNPPKRQRRWNSENIKVADLQPSNISPTTPKDVFQPSTKRSFNRSDSSVSGDAPKERTVPPSQNTATNSLRIDRFLRPFTLTAVKELLGKTGTVCNFWMDQIKTHCYVTPLEMLFTIFSGH
ncbi:apoptotic chromatin condensation inducer in the nucleus protein [Dioscorea alata]|uniref:Apoptotic chromatin condensation inducer in the nucleus protein n=1 Tax=Dioscorea alata TaxID=55571 RepID=A0ACB7TXD8_DIOAL|nr:apoptotic chromatin condensation inducer in the nucleus protein [Dioscorea alata]